jgi:hypothetical protein
MIGLQAEQNHSDNDKDDGKSNDIVQGKKEKSPGFP